jgi:hypothetical protein
MDIGDNRILVLYTEATLKFLKLITQAQQREAGFGIVLKNQHADGADLEEIFARPESKI